MTPTKSFEKIRDELRKEILIDIATNDEIEAFTKGFDSGYAHAMQSQEVAGLVEALKKLSAESSDYGDSIISEALAKFKGRE